jgi:hypothetical protein
LSKVNDASRKPQKAAVCALCGSDLRVTKYLEENCTYFYEIACKNGDYEPEIIQVARPLKPGSMCPNCLVGNMKQVPIQDRGMRLVCDSCLVVIPFGYTTKPISK